ncbi:MAG: hypothetical protein NTX76_06450 [Alphaproteobacteria bacterium]|nr:hypothetical protein [Alphaproteobacteria bacterium]
MRYFIICLLVSYDLAAMVGDGIHKPDDYACLAFSARPYSSACLVHDKKNSASQTGVLVAPTVVLTAAHGAMLMVKGKSIDSATKLIPVEGVVVVFQTQDRYGRQTQVSYDVDAVWIDGRYLESTNGAEAKHDKAFLRLKHKVTEIEPADVFMESEVPQDAPLTVVTFGNSDITLSKKITKRAFSLYERDTFYPAPWDGDALALNRMALYSSLFFKPDETLAKPTAGTDEINIRTYEATHLMV